MQSRLIGFAALVFVSACVGDRATSTGLRPAEEVAPQIVDAAHGGSGSHFFFLPPMVSNPTVSGTADGTLSPVVRVCEWIGTPAAGSCGPLVAVFTTISGTAGQTVRYDADKYRVNWRTDQCVTGPCVLDPAKTYRLIVLVGAVELGHADVKIVSNGSQLKNVNTNDYIGLVDGRTLPVQFRIEAGVVGAVIVTPAEETIILGGSTTFTASVVDLHGAPLAGRNVTWTSFSPDIVTVDGAGLASGVSVGSATIAASSEGVVGTGIGRVIPDASGASVIAFTSDRDGTNHIYVMGADGRHQLRLTEGLGSDEYPAWSPNGQQIAFMSDRDGNSEIYVMQADGSHQTRLTNTTSRSQLPCWSPDGTKIAFMSDRTGNEEIYVMNADGSGVVNLTNNPAADNLAAWSPDGSKILFVSYRGGGERDIYVMNADGSGVSPLPSNSGSIDSWPAWSPDGTKIVFDSDRDGDREVYVVNVDGSDLKRLTFAAGDDAIARWSPDGLRITFISTRLNGQYEIFAMDADGSHQGNLTNNPARDSGPTWKR